MTNGEKYLKDGADRHFLTDFSRWYYAITRDIKNVDTILAQFLSEKAQPTLTEDERVILRNLHYEKGAYEYERIGRTKKDSEGYSDLYLIEKDLTVTNFNEYLHLFQFIKERRRIFY